MRKYVICTLLILLLGLCGCGKTAEPEVDEFADGLIINDDGSVDGLITGFFDKDYYSLEDLTSMVNEELENYDGAELSDTLYDEASGGVSVKIHFDNMEAYNNYMDVDNFFGTFDEALLSDLISNTELISTKNDSLVTLDSDFTKKYGDYHVLITKDNMNIYTYSKVVFMDEYASLIDNNKREINLFETDGYHIIIFK